MPSRLKRYLRLRSSALSDLGLATTAKGGWASRSVATHSCMSWKKRDGADRFVVVGYVVMPEHVHLLISEAEEGTPSTVMQVVKQRGLAQPSILISSRTTTKVAPSFAIFEGWARCCLQRLCSASMASGAKSPQILPSPDGTAKGMPFHKPALAAARTSIFQAKTFKRYGSVVPTLAKNARVGHPQSWCVPNKKKEWTIRAR